MIVLNNDHTLTAEIVGINTLINNSTKTIIAEMRSYEAGKKRTRKPIANMPLTESVTASSELVNLLKSQAKDFQTLLAQDRQITADSSEKNLSGWQNIANESLASQWKGKHIEDIKGVATSVINTFNVSTDTAKLGLDFVYKLI